MLFHILFNFSDLFLHVLFNLLNNSYHHSSDIGDWGLSPLLSIRHCVLWLLTFWGVIIHCLFLFPISLFWDLVGGFSHLKSFPWIHFYVLAGLVIARLLYHFCPLTWRYNVALTNSQIQCQSRWSAWNINPSTVLSINRGLLEK
jgi:hypothetical protein